MKNSLKTDAVIITNINDIKTAEQIAIRLKKEQYKVSIALEFNYECKIRLFNTLDIIILLSQALIDDFTFFELFDWILSLNQRYVIIKTTDVKLNDYHQFLPLTNNLNITTLNPNHQTFYQELFFLLTSFKKRYYNKIKQYDLQQLKENNCLHFLMYLLTLKIYRYQQIKMLIPIDKNTYYRYLKLFRKLLIIQKNKQKIIIMSEEIAKQLLKKYYYHTLIKTPCEINDAKIYKQLFEKVEQINQIINKKTNEEYNQYFEQIYQGYLNHYLVDNPLFTIFKLINLVICHSQSFSFMIPLIKVIEIKNFIRKVFISQSTFNNSIFKIYINQSLIQIKTKNFKIYHQLLFGQTETSICHSKLIVHLVTNDIIYNIQYLNLIRFGIKQGYKMLFIYLDHCEFGLEMKYLIQDYPNICFWAYHTINSFFSKYEKIIEDLIISPNQCLKKSVYVHLSAINIK